MNRQCREETSLAINGWQHIVDMHCGADIIINVFRTFDDLIYDAADVTDEEPQIVAVPLLWEHAVIPNLHWLIPLCLDQQIITDPHSRPAMGAHNLFFEDNPS
ncbi:MAG: hypothetical protein U5P41_07335 [Gammaproteobacteria bacterium]|nr:hypothetical protein [Gammaproteobacteria bacterium]